MADDHSKSSARQEKSEEEQEPTTQIITSFGLQQSLDQLKKEIDPKIKILEKLVLSLEKKIKPVERKVNNIQIKSSETLGIFTALFTFISIEFQLSRGLMFKEFIFFTILFAFLLTFFVLVLHFVLNDKVNQGGLWLLLILALVLAFTWFITPNYFLELSKGANNFNVEKIDVGKLTVGP